MAEIRVRSTDGNNADNGSSWALAKQTIAGAAAIDAAGDTIWFSQVHSEAAAGTYASPGTTAAPVRLLCGNDAADPPTALATGASFASSANNSLGISTGPTYAYGLTFIAGASTGAAGLNITPTLFEGENCTLRLGSTGASVYRLAGTDSRSVYRNCTLKFSGTTQSINGLGNSVVEILGGGLEAGTTTPTTLTTTIGNGTRIRFSGFDLSAASSSMDLCSSTSDNSSVTFRDCKMPASWSGSLHSGTPGVGSVYEMINCDSADTHYTYRKAAQFGTVRDETTLVRTGGQTIDGTGVSLKMESNANAEFPLLTLDTYELQKEVTSVGSAVTATVEFLHDSATALKDNEIWLEVQYLGTSGVPLASFVSDGISVVATAADQASSSETWTTTGMANPNKQKLSVTFTPQEAGMIIATVRLAKASTTVYVDPTITLT